MVLICTLSFEYIFGYINLFQQIKLSVGYDADTVHVTQQQGWCSLSHHSMLIWL